MEEAVHAVRAERSEVGLTSSANWTVAGPIAQAASTAVTNTEVSAWQQHCVTGVCKTDDTLCSSIVIQRIIIVVMVTAFRTFLLRREKTKDQLNFRGFTASLRDADRTIAAVGN